MENINPLFWNGKIILDIGSGTKEMDKPQDAFPGARAFAVDPEFGGEIKANNAHGRIKGVVEALPFSDNLFDLVLSYYSFPMYFNASEIPPIICEMLRVIKPTGDVRLYPVYCKKWKTRLFLSISIIDNKNFKTSSE